MFPSAPRRVWLPWLLLIVPTLLVGVAMLWLLHNDRQRLEAARTDTLSRANQAARVQTQLAADNIELLVAEIRDGLIRELSETPEADLDPLLRNWPTTNPLVAQTFLWRSPEEGLVWPDTASTEHRAFRQRHASLFNGTEPGLPRELSVAGQSPKPAGENERFKQREAASGETVAPGPTPAAAPPRAATASEAQVKSDASAVPARLAIQLPPGDTVQAAAKEQAEPMIAQTEGNAAYGNSNLQLNQELRRDVYTFNRLSAAEAKRAARGENDLGLAENNAAPGSSSPANSKAGLVDERQNRALLPASKGSSSSYADSAAPATSSVAASTPRKKTSTSSSRARGSGQALASVGDSLPPDRYTGPDAPDAKKLPLPAAESVTHLPAAPPPHAASLQTAATEFREAVEGKALAKDAEKESHEPSAGFESAAATKRKAELAPMDGSRVAPPGPPGAAESVRDQESSRSAGGPTTEDSATTAQYRKFAFSDRSPVRDATKEISPTERATLDELTTAQSGWIARRLNGQTYFLGWWQPRPGAPVRGVELNLAAVLERVQALVPNGLSGERYRLLGPAELARDADVIIPLSSTLPGWALAAWFAPIAEAESLSAPAFFGVAVLLVVVFVGAVLAGGAMFFRQAAAAERDAALKTNFVSNVSHEMKTPLTTIRMYAEMLADERVSDPEKRRRYFATIGRETTRLARLVNNALDFGRLEAGRKDYRTENIVLGPWLVRLAETHAPRLAEAGVKLTTITGATARIARIDADSLEQMTLNLLDNAVKYAASGGEVVLQLDPGPGNPALIVSDRGPGVPAAHRERIFERFHRVDDDLTAKTQGAGLGLTIARRLARDQGGDLFYRDRAGGGAEFVLVLPGSEVASDANDETGGEATP